MPVQPILLYPDHRLKKLCKPVVDFDEASSLVQDLLDTMDEGPPRTVGIAAPQIGALLRVALVHSERNLKYPGGNGFVALINPVIEEREGEQIFREGCLSLPDYTANIRRSQNITVSYYDGNGARRSLIAEGFESVVIQHEIDHLDGILFLDRVTDIKTDLFRRTRPKVLPES
jgi:peptide deformylase